MLNPARDPSHAVQAEFDRLLSRFKAVRATSEAICAPLQTEDYLIQSMPDVSPPKWHLAHISWFFEAFVLKPYLPGYKTLDAAYDFLFNSYYETHGQPFPRASRGFLSRPGVADVYRFRQHIDQAIGELLDQVPPAHATEIVRRIELGLHHEQQHQELLLMDIKHILAQNPLNPAYRNDLPNIAAAPCAPLQWHGYPAGLRQIGSDGSDFAFDCETPRHRHYLEAFELASRPVSNGEYLDFIEAGGYSQSQWWLSDGWSLLKQVGWQAPLYWQKIDGHWYATTLAGLQPIERSVPVCHLSFYEADAYATWAGARLPTEVEWEVAAAELNVHGNFLESDYLQPCAPQRLNDATVNAPPSAITPENVTQLGPQQMFGDVWEWTGSAFRPYPGFKPLPGSLGEYNGKFMSGQMVLRGGCCITPQEHIRASYRNFFYPGMRWQFGGVRLAREV